MNIDLPLNYSAVALLKLNPNPEALYRRLYDDAITQCAIEFTMDGANYEAFVAVIFRVPFAQVQHDVKARRKAIAEGSV
jgi:hypothetical protein